jgi:hypothetical protein
MNERIKELKQQAIDYAWSLRNEGNLASLDDIFQAKFAELIVQECITIAKNWEDELENANLLEESNAVGIVAYRIARQFGVE